MTNAAIDDLLVNITTIITITFITTNNFIFTTTTIIIHDETDNLN